MIALMLAAAPLLAALAPLQPQVAAPGAAAVTPERMRRHVEVLASDEYEGRKPGTAGENKTLLYIASQLQALGLEPAGEGGSWYQPVPLVERRPLRHQASWSLAGRPLDFDQGDIVLVGRGPEERVDGAPVILVGHGTPEQIAAADLEGAVALLLYDAPKGSKLPGYSERARSAAAAGAAAVIAIMADKYPWNTITEGYSQPQTKLQMEAVAPIRGAIPEEAAGRLLARASSVGLRAAADPGFRPQRLSASASLAVATNVRPFVSHNMIGRLRGAGATGESLLYLGHWDHLGICRPADPADKICNGAVDNASGIAMLIEIARAMGAGPRPARDLLFMATTAEEVGLLGAEYFGARPTVPLASLVAAINIDTVAIAGRGEPVAIVGRGTTPLDPLVDETALELGRRIDPDEEANAFVQRQDGWALTRAGVPTVMVGGSFANMKTLEAFLSGPYHKPDDDLARPLVLDGAVEDTELLIALGRKLADPARYRPERR